MPRTKQQIDASYKLVSNLSEQDRLDKNLTYKCLISLAYEYTLIDDMATSCYLISKCPKSYFETSQLQQMAEDSTYEEDVILLTYALIQRGLVDGSDKVFVPNMQPGRA
jgi:hypothetical protein